MTNTREGSASRQARWQAIAQHRGLYAWLMRPISWVYGALAALRKQGYVWGFLKSHPLPIPVIVVGNVVVGGAGKTPTVIALVQHLRAQGWQPGVVSRGYGRNSHAVVEVTRITPCTDSGDEPALIQQATGVPVFVARQRVAAAQALLAAHPHINVLVCDDGLQHWALARDIAIAVFDERGCGNGWLLPAGLLREPWPPVGAAAFRPDLVLCQHREGKQPPDMASVPDIPVFNGVRRLASHAIGPDGHRIALEQLKGRTLTAMAGIARPSAFFDMLRACGLTLARELPLPDHAPPTAYAELQRSEKGPLICTEKDAIKCFGFKPESKHTQPEIWAVPLELVPESGFFAAIDARLVIATAHRKVVNSQAPSI